jgi:hypothetical protein
MAWNAIDIPLNQLPSYTPASIGPTVYSVSELADVDSRPPHPVIVHNFWKHVAEITTRYRDINNTWIGGPEIKAWNNSHREVSDMAYCRYDILSNLRWLRLVGNARRQKCSVNVPLRKTTPAVVLVEHTRRDATVKWTVSMTWQRTNFSRIMTNLPGYTTTEKRVRWESSNSLRTRFDAVRSPRIC